MSDARKGRPITDRRLARMAGILARRQLDVAVVIENVHDAHNVSAVLRSCDATGVATAHLVYTDQELPELSKGVSASAQRWLDVHHHDAIEPCYARLREAGQTIYATYLSDDALDLYELDLTKPCAFVFGNESLGVSTAALEGADARLKIPMMGMVDSLNISVAAAVTLYEVLRQRREAGLYAAPAYPESHMRAQLRAWLLREDRDPARADDAIFTAEAGLPPARNRYLRGQG